MATLDNSDIMQDNNDNNDTRIYGMEIAPINLVPVTSKNKWMPMWVYRLPFYTTAMFVVYISIYFTICTNPKDGRNDSLAIDTTRGKEVYRWYTYSLLHLNKNHIGINLLCLSIYGSLIEFDNNTWRLVMIHTLSILGGAFGAGWEARFTKESQQVVGASGGNYGLLSSQIGNLVLNWTELTLFRKTVFTLLIVSTVISDIIVNVILFNPKVSYSTHVGGFIFGLFAGLVFLKNQKKQTWERIVQLSSLLAFGVLSLTSAVNLGTLSF